ncbi:sterile alpha motif domain-containing protein 9-like [Saccostrea cucullata]|uniref:sterile alpha motif domain-containing protein 9-like n=1 Tax=Saccostrea cuccullata TaxID=36930 RepID=UPI002ED335C3
MSAPISMQEIQREVEFGFLASGKDWQGNWTTIEMVLSKVFPKAKKKKKKGNRSTTKPAFQYLKRRDGEKGSFEGEDCKDLAHLTPNNNKKQQPLHQRTSQDLCKVLKPYFKEHQLDLTLLDILIEEEVNGEIFMNLKMNETVELFPSLTFGKRKKIILIRDDLKYKEEKGELIYEENVEGIDSEPGEEKSNQGQLKAEKYRETFRKFGCKPKESNSYLWNSALIPDDVPLQSLLIPLHYFINEKIDEQQIPDWIATNAMPFIAACLNERRNGTIHFGVAPFETKEDYKGSVVGFPVDKKRIIRRFYHILRLFFYEDDFETVCKCIRQPQFIPVTFAKDMQEFSKDNLFVVEIDVVPCTIFTEENVFFLRQNEGDDAKKKAAFFRFKKGSNEPIMGTAEDIRNYMAIKSKISTERKTHEEKPVDIEFKENLRQKFLDLYSAGFETVKEEIHPVLLLSPLDSNLSDEFVPENFEFLNDLDPSVVFDFDFCDENSKGMYQFVENDQEQCLKVLTTDAFDKNSQEFKKESFSNMLDDLRTSSIKPWIFCNGYSPLLKEPLKRLAWKQERIEGYKEAVRFFSDEIPPGRAIVIFLLFSKNYDILLDAAEEIISKFKGHWLLLAESEEIASHWKKELLHRQCVDKKALEYRCIIGIPWKHVNLMIKTVTGAKKQSKCLIPTAKGPLCNLREKFKSELFDLSILSANECENDTEIMNDREKRKEQRKIVEEDFFKGAPVTWWNLSFGEDHVVKRSIHPNLLEKVKLACSKSENEDENKVSIVKLFHQPGAGGTTSAMQVLWDLKDEYRCAVVKKISELTCEQIEKLRNYEESETPKPPIILIDNSDEEKVITLCAQLENRARIASRRNEDRCQVFCMLLLCIRKPNLPSFVNKGSVQLRHELEKNELDWFQEKGDKLQKQFLHENGVDPQLLLSFNLLKENFNPHYREQIIKQFVDNIDNEEEKCLLRYLSLMNSFDIDFQPVPVSAFDLLMSDTGLASQQSATVSSYGIVSQMRRKGWEVHLTQSLLVLINRSANVKYSGQLKGLYIINQLFAKEIFTYIQDKLKWKTSKMMLDFLKSPMFQCYNKSLEVLHKVVRDILKKRQSLDDQKREKFSPLIMDILAHEDADRAGQVLEYGFELLKDPMVAQQVARLYYTYKNWEKAEHFAKIATGLKPDNSFLWDTYGQIFKTRLKEMYMECSQNGTILSAEEVLRAVSLVYGAIEKFKMEQITCEKEYYSKNNDNGYFAEVVTTITFLDLLHFYPDTNNMEILRRFLVEPHFVPKSFQSSFPWVVTFIKSFYARTSFVMRCIDEKISQLKSWQYNGLLSSMPDQRKMLFDLKENLDKYFGEESNDIPALDSEEQTIEFVRRRIRKLSGSSLKDMIDLRTDDDGRQTLQTIESLILEKVMPHCISLHDLITLIGACFIKNLNRQGQEKEFRNILRWTSQAYDMANSQKENHIYLEAYLFLVLFHWQTENRTVYANEMCPLQQVQDAIKKWKLAFNKKYTRQKDDINPYQRRETTFFYLGKGLKFAEIVYYEDLFIDEYGSRYLRSGDSIWQKPAVRSRLQRIQGTLKTNGIEVLVPLKSSLGNVNHVTIPTSLPISNRALWNKKVFFFLGFTWSGPKAFDVSQDNIDATSRETFGTTKSSGLFFRGAQHRQVSSDVITNEEYLKKLTKLNERLKKIQELKKLKVTSREREEIQMEEELRKERDELIRRRDDFLSGTAAES